MTVPSWCPRLAGELKQADVRASAVTAGLTAAELNWKPRPGSWSVGQCVDHLVVTNRVYLTAMSSALEGRGAGHADDLVIGWFGRWFIRNYADPVTARTRARAPGKIKPSPDVDAAVLEDFLASNAAARDFVQRCAGYDVNRIRFRNPFVPLLRFTVGTGLEILVRHQRRHLLQAEGIRALLRP